VDLVEMLTERLWATVARARAEAALREGEERLRMATEAAQVGVWMWDIPTDAMTWTPLCKRLFGLPESEAITYDHFLAILHPEDRRRTDEEVRRTLREGTDYSCEYRAVWPDGAIRYISAAGRCEYDVDHRPRRMMGVVLDVTDRVLAERERARLETRLRQSQRMEALGTLAGGIAHDFNNILTALGGNLALAAAELPPQHPALVFLAESRKATQRAAELVRRVLAFARPARTTRAPTDLRPVIEEASRLLRAALPAMIDVRVEADPDAPPAMADAAEIQQALMNLGSNARDAMAERGGTLTLRLRAANAATGAPLAELGPGPHVVLGVSDSGHGMTTEVAEHVFEPFFTTKPPGQGTGLGLSVVHGIVRTHEGAIRVTTEPGRGSSFDIYLPAAIEPAPRPAAAAPTPGRRGRGEHLLYVDDEPALVRLAVRALTRIGYEVTVVASAGEALAAITGEHARFALVVTDMGMPGMTGLDLARHLHATRPELPIVITSGLLSPEVESAARALDVRALLPKPCTLDQLAATVRDVTGPAPGPA
jgi:PAS domain S-box-containing protein